MTSRPAWSAPCVHDSGCCKRPHFLYSASTQHLRATFQSCSGCGDVVDQHHHAGNRDPGTGIRKCECILDIRQPFLSGQLDLRSGMSDSPQQRMDRRAEMDREFMGLIESTAILAPAMQRNRDYAIGVAQDCRARLTHQRAEAWRDRVASIVLQRVNDVFHPAVVGIDGGLPGDRVRLRETLAQRCRDADARPADFADRAIQWTLQRRPARCTWRLE